MWQRRLYSAFSSAVFARPLRNPLRGLGTSQYTAQSKHGNRKKMNPPSVFGNKTSFHTALHCDVAWEL